MPTPPENAPPRTFQTQTKDDIRPATHKTQAAPKVLKADDSKRYSVINTVNKESFGSGLPLLAARKLASSLSSSHKCRTAKVVEDAPSTPTPVASTAPTTVRAPSAGTPQHAPPSVMLAGAAAAAAQAAAEAQARHTQLMAEKGATDRIASAVDGAIAEVSTPVEIGDDDGGGAEVDGEPGTSDDVDVDDLLDGTEG